jgi:hypothetical protein
MNNSVTGFLLLCFLLKVTAALAQQDENICYFNKDGKKVNTRDSADYYRVIDSKEGDIFKFTEYRANGTQVKASAKGTFESFIYDGYVNLYYKNGNVAEMDSYTDGHENKSLQYHINGTLLRTIIYGDDPSNRMSWRVIYAADSTGKVNILNGKGVDTETGVFNRGMLVEHYTLSGPYLNGIKEGEWEGTNDRNIHFKQKYKAGKLISGESRSIDGKSYKYLYEFEYPIFKNGRFAFENWIGRHLLHPSDSINLKNKNSRWLALNYLIDANGQPTAIKGLKADGLTEVPMGLNKNPPKWAPATLRGVPVSYQMKYDQESAESNHPLKKIPFNTDVYLSVPYRLAK